MHHEHARWQENGLVFPSSIGTPMNRHNLFLRHFKPLLKKAGLPDIAFHDLRHTFATIMLFEWGVSPRTVQEMMGHASIKITMDIYSHVMPNHQADEIRRLEKLFSERSYLS
jgi:integrase